VSQQLQVPWDSQWRPIPGFPGYWISNYAQVFSMGSGRILSEWSNRWYDTYVTLRRGNRSYSRKVKVLYSIVWKTKMGLAIHLDNE
jgi:hypothetical protein